MYIIMKQCIIGNKRRIFFPLYKQILKNENKYIQGNNFYISETAEFSRIFSTFSFLKNKNGEDNTPEKVSKGELATDTSQQSSDVVELKPKLTEIIDSKIPDLDLPQVPYRPQTYSHPVKRTVNIVKDDLAQSLSRSIRKILPDNKKESTEGSLDNVENKDKLSLFNVLPEVKEIWPSTCDVLVVGGGIVGSSIAYHLKEKTHKGLDVVVVEKDPTYSQASTVRSVGGIRQQFSIPENIQLSQYGMEFLRNSPELLAIEGEDPVTVDFHPNGYLTLASDAGFEQLKENFLLQRDSGAKVQFLSPAHLKERYPWLSVDDIAAGVIGTENEGWFDPWSLLIALRRKAGHLGATYVNGEFMGAKYKDLHDLVYDGAASFINRQLDHAIIKLPNGEERTIKFAFMIVCGGAWSGEIGSRLGLQENSKVLATPIPIEPRKRFVYCVHCPDGPGLNSPLTIDPNGTYFRREGLGDMYLCGQSPLDEPSAVDLEVDENFFMENVWPSIANRAPSFENLKLKSSWAGYYDYNYFDQNGIVGFHPNFTNVILASGFSGHGLQQGPGIGRAIMELIVYSEYKSIDLSRLGYERIIMREPLVEKNIY